MTETTDPKALGAEIAQDILARAPFRDPGEAALPDIAAAYEAQQGTMQALSEAQGGIGGRKIAWNTAPQMEALGLSEPGAAFVMRDGIASSGARLSAGDYRAFLIEPEFCAVLSAPLAPRAEGWDRASVAACIEKIVPAFELLDWRGFAGGRAAAAVAANIFNAGVVLGGPGLAPSALDPDALHSVVTENGETILDKTAAAPMDPLDAAAFLANKFNALGHGPEAGEILMLGAHLPPRPVSAPASLRFSIDGFGDVAFEIA